MKFQLRWPLVSDREQQDINEGLIQAVNAIGVYIFHGAGVPTFDPGGPALFFRDDFGVGASVYGWDGTWHHLW